MLPLTWLFEAGLRCVQQSVTAASGSGARPPDLRLQDEPAAGRQQSAADLPVDVFWAPAGNSWPSLRSQATWTPTSPLTPSHPHPAGGPGRREASRAVTQTGWAFTHGPGSTNEQASLGYIYSLRSRRLYCLRPPDRKSVV